MVKVTGTKGNVVDIEIIGIGETIRRMNMIGQQIENSADLGVVKAGTYIEEEVKESIMGHKAEPRSVNTGQLANSIEFSKTGKAVGKIEPKGDSYPNGQTTKEVATYLEYGTSRISPRRHFRNTESRNKGKVFEIIKKEVDLAIQQKVKVGMEALKALGKAF